MELVSLFWIGEVGSYCFLETMSDGGPELPGTKQIFKKIKPSVQALGNLHSWRSAVCLSSIPLRGSKCSQTWTNILLRYPHGGLELAHLQRNLKAPPLDCQDTRGASFKSLGTWVPIGRHRAGRAIHVSYLMPRVNEPPRQH